MFIVQKHYWRTFIVSFTIVPLSSVAKQSSALRDGNDSRKVLWTVPSLALLSWG